MSSLKHYKIDFVIGNDKGRPKRHLEHSSLESAIQNAHQELMNPNVDEVYIYAPIKIVRLKQSPVIVEDIDEIYYDVRWENKPLRKKKTESKCLVDSDYPCPSIDNSNCLLCADGVCQDNINLKKMKTESLIVDTTKI